MGTLYKPGFTIIETMLFLAVTGLMVVGLLAGSGASINTQRYRDGVSSFQTLLQQQYSDVLNVRNNRDRLACDTNAQTSNSATDQTFRGQSNCMIVGRYLVVQGENITISNVLGYYSGEAPGSITQMQSELKLRVYEGSTQTKLMEWGTSLAWPTQGLDAPTGQSSGDRTLAVLILSAPANGFIYTFTADIDVSQAPASAGVSGLNTVVTADRYRATRVVCIAPNGLFTGTVMAVVIQPYASSTTAITLRSNDTAGDGQRC